MRPTLWILCFAVAALVDSGPTFADIDDALYRTRDYIRPDEWAAQRAAAKADAPSIGIRFPGAVCTACWGDSVYYTSIAPGAVEVPAQRYDASEVTLIVPNNLTQRAELTDERIRLLVGKLDALYAAYQRLNNGRTPPRSHDPAGKHIFAYVETLSGPAGLALIDSDIAEAALPNTPIQQLDDDLTPAIWVHELAHNFDMTRIGNYGGDPAHDWTVLLEGWYAPEILHNDLSRDMSGASFARQFYQLFFEPYLTDPTLTWVACAASFMLPECTSKRIFNPHGHVLTFAARTIGPEQTRRWIAQRYADQLAGVSFANQEELRDYFFTSLAQVTQTNTSCLSGMLKWPILDNTRVTLAGRYSTDFPACLDRDGDQTRAGFDCDDSDPSSHPGGAETADGRDNDCDGIVDNLAFDERTIAGGDFSDSATGTPVPGFPVHIIGKTRNSTDVDVLRLSIPTDVRAKLRLCTTSAIVRFTLRGSRDSIITPAVAGFCPEVVLEADRTWQTLEISATTQTQADYAVELYRERLASDAPTVDLVRDSLGGVRARVPSSLTGVGGAATSGTLELVWRSNLRGERARTPYNPGHAAIFPAPIASEFNTSSAPLELRAALERDGFPVHSASNPYLISTPGDIGLIDIGADAGGAWFNPAHDGEGFMIEVLEGGRVLVYWFTYDDRNITALTGTAQQIFLVGDGAFDGPILRADVLYRVLGGAFGTALDSTRLRTVDVGSLEFSFADSNRATVHYRIDGRSGETRLVRLTRLDRSASARGLSGNWYDPRYSGQGLIVQELGAGRLFSVFFTHDDLGQPRWFTLDGQIAANGHVGWSMPLTTRGGLFGRGYRPATVTRDLEGLFESDLTCAGASMRMRVPKISTRTETLQLVRLTTPAGTRCDR